MDAVAEPIVLRPIDEIAAMPPFSTVPELLHTSADRGRCELLPGSQLPASDWYPGAVASKAGDYSPPWWSPDPIIHSSAVHLFRLRDAYYMPAFGVIVTAAGEVMRASMFQASYRTPDLSLLPAAERRRDETILNVPRAVDSLDRIVVSMPWGATINYGHFLLDCLPAIALTMQLPEVGAYRFAFPPLEPWQRRHLQLLGVEDAIELDRPIYRVSDLLFTSCLGGFLNSPNVNYRTVRDEQLLRKAPTSLSFERIYISREAHPRRTMRSERRLEERLRQLDFTVVAPEEHTVDEQIDIFRNADLVVGCAGAAFANVLYCRRDTTVVEITPSRMVTPITTSGRWVYSLCAIVGCRWRPYYCAHSESVQTVSVGDGQRREVGFTFDLDIEDLVRYVEGFTASGVAPG
jgi:capsular polysaccharide biosynthesis protein